MDSLQTLVLAHDDTLVLGRYRLLERLGAGGFGVVFSAHDERLQREVALKRIFLPSADEHAIADRAEREAQATARLAHPAIVALYEARAEGDAFYLITELVHGDTLAALLAEGALYDAEVLAIGVALAGALEHAHARGVIHRDVKPQNILVPYDLPSHPGACAKLTDFGGARLAGGDVLTRTGDVLGTLAYMAPEQSEGREATVQADLYSLALVLYEALSGVNPVRGANPAATARRIGTALAPLERHRRDLPRALTRALDAALAPDPRHRGELPALRAALEGAHAQWIPGPHEETLARRDGVLPPRHLPVRARCLQGLQDSRAVHGPGVAYDPRIAPDSWPTPDPQIAAAALPLRRAAAQIPRPVWLLATVAVLVWQMAAGHPGVALLALAAALPLLLVPRTSVLALAAAGAPALGTLGLAAMFPALAGQAARWPARAALGALAYWWLCLAEPLLGARLWLGLPGAWAFAPPAHASWEPSLGVTAERVLLPMLSVGVLAGVVLWAAGALLLPYLVRGRHAALDVIAATVWTAALLAALPLLTRGLPGALATATPRGALLGGLLGGALVVLARALRGPV